MSEFVICPECGKQYKLINASHLKKHDMTFDEFFARHPGYDILSDSVREKQRIHGSEMRKMNSHILDSPENIQNRIQRALVANKKTGFESQRIVMRAYNKRNAESGQISKWMTGRVCTDQARAKNSAAASKRFAEGKYLTKETLPHRMLLNAILDADESLEVLSECRVGDRIADLYIPDVRMVVEIYGCYWHGCSKCYSTLSTHQIKKHRSDRIRESYLSRRVNKYLIAWECDIMKDVDRVAGEVLAQYEYLSQKLEDI